MLLVERRVQRLEKKQGEREPAEQRLRELRETPAWVLLGEPGAGKSKALELEAEATGGVYVTVSEFVTSVPPPEEWRGKVLFIDALDETRAAGAESPIQRIRNQLRLLGRPSFRLSCRAADWQGATDTAELQNISPDGRVLALQLCQLTDEDIRQILQTNHGVSDPAGFIEQAERHRIEPLLRNPQMLKLLANAVRDGEWPESRSEVYRLACEKLLQENNPVHRKAPGNTPLDTDAALQVAGQLCAVLLLANVTGIALDPDAASDSFPELGRFKAAMPHTAERVLHSMLFLQAASRDERLIPCHRTIAEYLAARWLADQLDRKALPQGRLLNLLLGFDGGVVANLRGLFAWLALCSPSIRTRLIDVDPLGIVLYGDVGPFSPADKRQVLQALRKQAEQFPGFRWRLGQDMSGFGALADRALQEDFRRVLQSEARDDGTQAHIDCVLDILEYGGVEPSLADPLLAIIEDASFWPRLRHGALRVWLKQAPPAQVRALLDQVIADRLEDEDDGLYAQLLEHLYPDHLEPQELLECLHSPTRSRTQGSYNVFWEYQLSRLAPDHHLPVLLEGLSELADVCGEWRQISHSFHFPDHLLVRALGAFGELATDEQLFNWLAAGADEYGYFHREAEAEAHIRTWLEQHPDRYKAVLAECVQAIARDEPGYQYARLHNAPPPADIGLWHLQQAETSDEVVASIHLQNAVLALQWGRGAEGVSLEVLGAWGQRFPEREGWLRCHLICNLEREQWRQQDAVRKARAVAQQAEQRLQRTQEIAPLLSDISTGTASPGVLYNLACVWLKHFSDISGNTVSERFSKYSDQGDELMQAAESGFKGCLQRKDLPSVDEIIRLHADKRFFYIAKPCLLGLQLSWKTSTLHLVEERLEQLLAFFLSDTGVDVRDWASHIAAQQPELFARVLIRHARATFAAGRATAGLHYLLCRNPEYHQVAALACPELLRLFPESAAPEQLHALGDLLYAAMAAAPESLSSLGQSRLASPHLDMLQRPLWLAIRTLAGDDHCAEQLWIYIAGESHAEQPKELAAGLLVRGIELQAHQLRLPEISLSRLIEAATPVAELDRARGGELGDLVRKAIGLLGTYESSQELRRLSSCPAVSALHDTIRGALQQQQARLREARFQFPDLRTVVEVLANRAPTSVADLAQLTLNHLDDIAYELRHANDDGYRAFWNVWEKEKKVCKARRGENICRDALLTRLRPRLEAHGIKIDPEVDHAGDKRADLGLDYRNQLTLPIEIKRDDNRELWTSLRAQLMALYVSTRKAQGHGIFLVFWFGESGELKAPPEEQAKPATPEELKTMLEAQLTEEEHKRIFVRVLDVSWPGVAPKKRKNNRPAKAAETPEAGPAVG